MHKIGKGISCSVSVEKLLKKCPDNIMSSVLCTPKSDNEIQKIILNEKIDLLKHLVKHSHTVIGDKVYDEFISKESMKELMGTLTEELNRLEE